MSEQYKDNTFCFNPKKKICTCRSLCLQVCKKVFKPVKNVFNTILPTLAFLICRYMYSTTDLHLLCYSNVSWLFRYCFRIFVQYSILSFNFSYSLISTVNTLMIELHLKKKVFKYFMIQIDLLVIFTLHNTSVSTSAQEAVDQKKDMDEEDEEDHDESMEDDEDLSEEDMEEDKQGSLAKAAITGRSVTLQMLISEKIIEPGPALLSLKYLVKDYSVPVTVTIYSVTGTLY